MQPPFFGTILGKCRLSCPAPQAIESPENAAQNMALEFARLELVCIPQRIAQRKNSTGARRVIFGIVNGTGDVVQEKVAFHRSFLSVSMVYLDHGD